MSSLERNENLVFFGVGSSAAGPLGTVSRLDLVAEFLLGTRVNHDGQRGSATQTQIGSTFRF